MKKKLQLPHILSNEETSAVKRLQDYIHDYTNEVSEQFKEFKEIIQGLRDEIAILKGEKPKPKIKPSNLDKKTEKEIANHESKPPEKRPGSTKRAKTADLEISKTTVIKLLGPLPQGAIFKGHRKFTVQDLEIKTNHTLYKLEIWQMPDGSSLTAKLPNEISGEHFGSKLRSFIIYQYYQCHVTQPILREMLQEMGFQISSGQINNILIKNNEIFIHEKNEILTAGLAVNSYVTVDDSGARHKGKNGYVTHIGNEFFAWFGSSFSKSRINFLELLHAGNIGYEINADALSYMKQQILPEKYLTPLQSQNPIKIDSASAWESHLDLLGIHRSASRKKVTEGALLGSLLAKGFNPDLAIISDGARQFNVLMHGLCWVHTERLIKKLVGFDDKQRSDLTKIIDKIWKLYRCLKEYKSSPNDNFAMLCSDEFDRIFTKKTGFATLDSALSRIYSHKTELLLVLARPDVPIHTNGSETDIREFVKKAKISGGTRSDLGKICRDAFASLKKTARKLKISFWDFIYDRITKAGKIPPLFEIIRERAT